jgi:hypothetical protein
MAANKHPEISRERILRLKPWLLSTGPKTAEGKARLRHLRRVHGLQGEELRLLLTWAKGVETMATAVAENQPTQSYNPRRRH